MRVMARIAVVFLSLALVGTLTTDAVARTKHCKKGYVLKTVKKNGKKVKVCRKKKKPASTTPTNNNTGGDQTGTGGDQTGTGGDQTGTGGTPTTPFPRPAAQTTGEDAYNLIAPFFVNSHFTDCPGGGFGVTCSVETVYRHCAGGGKTGGFEYHRYTPTSGADINSYGTYGVRSAESDPDGSWKIEYNVDSYGNYPFYHWEVSPDGTVVGSYYFPGPNPSDDPDGPETIGPLKWEQPSGC